MRLLMNLLRRAVALINVIIGASDVEFWMICIRGECAITEHIVNTILFYLLYGASLTLAIASLVVLFVPRSPIAWVMNVLAALLLTASHGKLRLEDISNIEGIQGYDGGFHVELFAWMFWLLLNLLQTWGLNARTSAARDGDELSRHSGSPKAWR